MYDTFKNRKIIYLEPDFSRLSWSALQDGLPTTNSYTQKGWTNTIWNRAKVFEACQRAWAHGLSKILTIRRARIMRLKPKAYQTHAYTRYPLAHYSANTLLFSLRIRAFPSSLLVL